MSQPNDIVDKVSLRIVLFRDSGKGQVIPRHLYGMAHLHGGPLRGVAGQVIL